MARRFVAYVDMVADLFHAGHVNFLRQTRSLAEERARHGGWEGVEVVVGLMGDDAATRYKRRPVMTLAERAAIVEACRYVDRVVLDCPCPITAELIAEEGISLVVHGDDFDDATNAHWYGVPMRLGIFATVPYTDRLDGGALSTSDLIARVHRRDEPGS